MARTIDEIKDLIIESKERIVELYNDVMAEVLADPLLSNLNSTSQTSIWRLWAFVTAFSMWVHETLWDAFKIEITEIASNAITGTARWYRDQCLKFQYGHQLVFDNYKIKYLVDDPASRIVTQASVIETQYGQVLIKVAKGVSGALMPLNGAELIAFNTYINNVKFAGTITNISSLPADLMVVDLVVHFNPVFILNDLQLRVENAITDYLQNLPFNGLFYQNALIDAIQAVDGVIDVDVNGIQAWQGAAVPSAINRIYQSQAGYIQVDPANPLTSTITYNSQP